MCGGINFPLSSTLETRFRDSCCIQNPEEGAKTPSYPILASCFQPPGFLGLSSRSDRRIPFIDQYVVFPFVAIAFLDEAVFVSGQLTLPLF